MYVENIFVKLVVCMFFVLKLSDVMFVVFVSVGIDIERKLFSY